MCVTKKKALRGSLRRGQSQGSGSFKQRSPPFVRLAGRVSSVSMILGMLTLHPRAVSSALNKLEEDDGTELPLGPITPKKFDYRVRLMLFFGIGFILGVAALFVFLGNEFDGATSLRSSVLAKPSAPSEEIKEILKEGGGKVYEERNNFVKNDKPVVGGNVPTPAPFGFSWERNKKPTKPSKTDKDSSDIKVLPPEIMYGGIATNP